MFFTCGWSRRMPVSKTPILTSSPRKPWFHSVSAENMETTLERSAISFLLPPPCSLPSSYSPWEGRVENLYVPQGMAGSSDGRQCLRNMSNAQQQ